MGARSGYSILDGIIVAFLIFIGGPVLVLKVIPLPAVIPIMLWVGISITAYAFAEAETKVKFLAVSIGLIPALGAWALNLISNTLNVAGVSFYDTYSKFGATIYINGVIALSQGYLLVSVIFSSAIVFFIDRKFLRVAFLFFVASFLSILGLIHAFEVTPTSGVTGKFIWSGNGVAAPEFAIAYFGLAIMSIILNFVENQDRDALILWWKSINIKQILALKFRQNKTQTVYLNEETSLIIK